MPSLLPKPVSTYLAKRRQARAVRIVEENISPAGKAILSLLGGKPEDFIRKEQRSVVPERITRYTDLVEPQYDPWQLQNLYETQWVVRMCVDKLVRESTRQGWHFEPRYEVRCDTCETEYDYVPISKVCPSCSESTHSSATNTGGLSPPDASQIEHAKEFLDNPNPDGLTCDDLLKRAVKDLLIFDDFYQSVALDKEKKGQYWERLQLFPEDARMMKLQSDDHGRLGGKTFCQICEATKTLGAATKLYPPEDEGKTCPDCGQGKLVQMAYAQVKGSQPVTAWTKDEIVHGNLWAIGARLFGVPKLWAIQTQVVAMALIDKFQKDAFDKTTTPKTIYLVKGIDPKSLNSILRMHEQAKEINPMADLWIPLPAQSQGNANFGIEKIPGLDSPLIEGSLPYQEFSMKAICYTFGVSPSAIGMETPGRLGTGQTGTEQTDVTPETINEIQKQVSETFDRFLKRFFQEIKDFNFRLKTAHEGEDTEEWNIKKLQMETAKLAIDAGFEVLIDEDGTPKISGEGKRQELPSNPFGGGGGGFGNQEEDEKETEATYLSKSLPHMSKDRAALIYTPDEIEKANRSQAVIRQGVRDYKVQLDAFSERIFSALKKDFDDIFSPNLPDNKVDPDLKMTVIGRVIRILDHYLLEGERLAKDAAEHLYRLGRMSADTDTRLVSKQEGPPPDSKAVENSRKRTIESMRNTLYWGDKTSYLQKISDTLDVGIEENWSVDQLARELQKELDPEKEHFSKYMWERIARTESASYVTQGTIDAYSGFGVQLLKRVVTIDERTDPVMCLPFSGSVYRMDDADNVIPAHPNCRCAFAPYFGQESEALDSFDVIHNF